MSLHNLAQHMQSAGRGEDKMLVHMTPGEVQGLQSLAMAHGGSLTINPQTGLPEAGILSKLLPMAAGFALGPGGFALMSAPAAGLAVGAVSTLATGSLGKGIMAGLGAYGGASLGGALGTMGTAAAAPAASTAGSAYSATLPGAAPSAFPSMIPDVAASPLTNAAITPGLTAAGGFQSLPAASLANANTASSMFGGVQPEAIVPPPPVNTLQQVAQPPVMKVPTPDSLVFNAPRSAAPVYTPADQLYAQKHPVLAGLKSATSSMDGLKTLYSTMEDENKYSGLAAGYSTLSALNEPPKVKSPKSKGMIRPYTLERKRVIDENVGPSSSAEQRYFNDVYTAQTPYAAASGGVMRMADGGYVDEIMNQDAVDVEKNRPIQQQPMPMFMGMQPPQNIIAQPGNTMATPGFAGGGSTPTSGYNSSYYNQITGQMDVSKANTTSNPEAAKSSKKGIPEYEYLGNNQYRLATDEAAPKKEAPPPKYAGWSETQKVMSPEDITGIWKRMGGTGEVPADFMKKYSGNKRSEHDIAKGIKALPAFTAPFGIAGAKNLSEEDRNKALQIQAERINPIANAMLGRNATPEEIARLSKTDFSLAGVRDFFGKEAKGEYGAYQQKAFEERIKPAPVVAPVAPGATPTQVANIYSNIFGDVPDVKTLDYYAGLKMSPEAVKKSLMESEQYKKELTTPFVAPISYTGSTFSPEAIKTQLGRDPSAAELKTAQDAFIPNRATIAGAPEYQTPEQRIGLAPRNAADTTPDFYSMLNKKLGEQTTRLTAPAAAPVAPLPAIVDPTKPVVAEEEIPTGAEGGDVRAFSLGGYSDGGRLLRGPGDGVSDSIPASIGDRQPARLADGEFVIPARIVSELGNGSTEAGAKRLYAMMDRVQKARQRTVGKNKVAVNSKADRYLPA